MIFARSSIGPTGVERERDVPSHVMSTERGCTVRSRENPKVRASGYSRASLTPYGSSALNAMPVLFPPAGRNSLKNRVLSWKYDSMFPWKSRWSCDRFVNSPASNRTPATLPWAVLWDDTSITRWLAPALTPPAPTPFPAPGKGDGSAAPQPPSPPGGPGPPPRPGGGEKKTGPTRPLSASGEEEVAGPGLAGIDGNAAYLE